MARKGLRESQGMGGPCLARPGLRGAGLPLLPSPPWRRGPPGAQEEGRLETTGFHLETLFIWPGMEKGWGQSARIPMETAMSLAPGGPWPWWGMGRPSWGSGAPLAKGPGPCLCQQLSQEGPGQ